MYNEQRFDDDVNRIFSEIIQSFGFEIEEVNKEFASISLINANCKIEFVYDRGEVGCSFLNPKNPRHHVYPVYSVWKYLFPNDTEQFNLNDYSVEAQLRSQKLLISERLINVLNGDFSWVDSYNRLSSYHRKLVEFMFNNFSAEHSIKKKYWAGDETWQEDLRKYLNEQEIRL